MNYLGFSMIDDSVLHPWPHWWACHLIIGYTWIFVVEVPCR